MQYEHDIWSTDTSLAKHDEINEVVSKYKSGKTSHDECFKHLAQAFMPLFWKKKSEMSNVNTDHTWIGDFFDVYLKALDCSLSNFDPDIHNGIGKNKLSIVPYFTSLFNARCDSYKKVIYQVKEEQKNNLSLDSLLESITFSKSNNVDIFDYIQHSDDTVKNEVEFENFLKSEVLTMREYKIFFMKMKGKSNEYIGNKMKKQVSYETIRREWNLIIQKIHVHVNKRKNDQ